MRNKAFDNIIKALCLALTLAMVIGLTACGSGSATNTNGQGSGSNSAASNGGPASGSSGSNPNNNTQTGIESILEFNDSPTVTLTANGETYELKKDIKTYLFIGIDSELPNDTPLGDKWAGSQCDVLSLYVIDEAKKEYSVLNINRDAVATVDVLDFDGNIIAQQEQQIEFAFSYTMNRAVNSENAVRAVSRLIGGIPIDGYVTIAMGALKPLNDAVGGITITIPEDLTRVDPAFEKGATLTLDGELAEKYIRARLVLENPSNQERVKRQQLYLNEFKNVVKQKINESSGFINDLYNTAAPYLTSDMSSGQITNIALGCVNYRQTKNLSLSGKETEVTYSTGQTHTEFTVNKSSLDNAVIELFYKKK